MHNRSTMKQVARALDLSIATVSKALGDYAGTDAPGYRVIAAQDLCGNADNNNVVPEHTVMHVMDALVSHGCLIVDVTNGGTDFAKAVPLAHMWKATERCFAAANITLLPPLQTAAATTQSEHAMVGFCSYENGDLQFLETRQERATGELLPSPETRHVIGEEGCRALRHAFAIVTDISKDVVRIVVAASTQEAGALSGTDATLAATKLANELLDDGKPLQNNANDILNGTDDEGSVSMSPHRLCRYANTAANNTDDKSSREVFGAHTDSTFITAVPVAAVAGLEVYDEGADQPQWYRPELLARRHWRAVRASVGEDPDAVVENVSVLNDNTTDDSVVEIPWHARYVVLMPGELLQIASRDEVQAAVHRVVVESRQEETAIPSFRLSAPHLLRGRPGTRWDCDRYLGGTAGSALLEECNGMTSQDIHHAMQQKQ